MHTNSTLLYYAMLCCSRQQARRYSTKSIRNYGFGIQRGLFVIVGPMPHTHLAYYPISNSHTYCLCRTHTGVTPDQAAQEAAKHHTTDTVGVIGFCPLVLRKVRSDRVETATPIE